MSLRDERGFTLVELLVVMSISLVVLSATLLTFNGLYQAEHDNDDRLDTAAVARNALDVQARQLRNLAKRLNNTAVIDTVSSYDLIFQTSEPSRTWVRYCLDTTNPPASADRGRLWTQELSLTLSVASPVSAAMRSGCPASSGWTTTRLVADHVTNVRAGQDRPLFSYRCTTGTTCTSDASTYDQVVNITARTVVDTTPGRGAAELRATSGVYLRNQNQPPVASFVATAASASRTVTLNASGSSDFEGRSLSYYWFKQTMPALASIDCANATVTGSGDLRTLWGAEGFIGSGITLSHTFPGSDGAAGSSRNIGLVVCDPGDRYGTAGITSATPVQIPN